ncbi:MAG: hypothetical protein LBR91_01930 [Puniceicoccales bacterium]|jgi:hypothetical protein|nr:hypothetical protein [Puniceicoccales bacterium]
MSSTTVTPNVTKVSVNTNGTGYTITQAQLDAVDNPFFNMKEAEAYHVLQSKQAVLGNLSSIKLADSISDGDIISIGNALGSTPAEDESLFALYNNNSNNEIVRNILFPVIRNILLSGGYTNNEINEIMRSQEDDGIISTGEISDELTKIGNDPANSSAMKFYFLDGTYDQITLKKMYEALTSEQKQADLDSTLKMLYGANAVYGDEDTYSAYYFSDGDDGAIQNESLWQRLKAAEDENKATIEYTAMITAKIAYDNAKENVDEAYTAPLFGENPKTIDALDSAVEEAQAVLDNEKEAEYATRSISNLKSYLASLRALKSSGGVYADGAEGDLDYNLDAEIARIKDLLDGCTNEAVFNDNGTLASGTETKLTYKGLEAAIVDVQSEIDDTEELIDLARNYDLKLFTKTGALGTPGDEQNMSLSDLQNEVSRLESALSAAGTSEELAAIETAREAAENAKTQLIFADFKSKNNLFDENGNLGGTTSFANLTAKFEEALENVKSLEVGNLSDAQEAFEEAETNFNNAISGARTNGVSALYSSNLLFNDGGTLAEGDGRTKSLKELYVSYYTANAILTTAKQEKADENVEDNTLKLFDDDGNYAGFTLGTEESPDITYHGTKSFDDLKNDVTTLETALDKALEQNLPEEAFLTDDESTLFNADCTYVGEGGSVSLKGLKDTLGSMRTKLDAARTLETARTNLANALFGNTVDKKSINGLESELEQFEKDLKDAENAVQTAGAVVAFEKAKMADIESMKNFHESEYLENATSLAYQKWIYARNAYNGLYTRDLDGSGKTFLSLEADVSTAKNAVNVAKDQKVFELENLDVDGDGTNDKSNMSYNDLLKLVVPELDGNKKPKQYDSGATMYDYTRLRTALTELGYNYDDTIKTTIESLDKEGKHKEALAEAMKKLEDKAKKFGAKSVKDYRDEFDTAIAIEEEAKGRLSAAENYLETIVSVLRSSVFSTDSLAQALKAARDAYNDGGQGNDNGTRMTEGHREAFESVFGAVDLIIGDFNSVPNAKTLDELWTILNKIKNDLEEEYHQGNTYTGSAIKQNKSYTAGQYMAGIIKTDFAAESGKNGKEAMKDLYNEWKSINDKLFKKAKVDANGNVTYDEYANEDEKQKGMFLNMLTGVQISTFALTPADYAKLEPYFDRDGGPRTTLSETQKGQLYDILTTVISNAADAVEIEKELADTLKTQRQKAEKAYGNAVLGQLSVGGAYNELVSARDANEEEYRTKLKAYEETKEYKAMMNARMSFDGTKKRYEEMKANTGATMDDLLSLCLTASEPVPTSDGKYKLVAGIERIDKVAEDGKINYEYKLIYEDGEDMFISESEYQESFSKTDCYVGLAIHYVAVAVMYSMTEIQRLMLAEQIREIEQVNEEIRVNNKMLKALSWIYERVYREATDGEIQGQDRQGAITSQELFESCDVPMSDLNTYMKDVVKNGGIASTGLSSFYTTFGISYGVDSGGTLRFAVAHYNKDGEKWTDKKAWSKDVSNIDVQEQTLLTAVTNWQDQVRLHGDKLSTDANLMSTKMQQFMQEVNSNIGACTQTLKSVGDYGKTTTSNIR